jgi:hypothetical protein
MVTVFSFATADREFEYPARVSGVRNLNTYVNAVVFVLACIVSVNLMRERKKDEMLYDFGPNFIRILANFLIITYCKSFQCLLFL